MSENTYYCSFCGKSQHECAILVAGVAVFICDECIELCRDIVGANRVSKIGTAMILWHPNSIPWKPPASATEPPRQSTEGEQT